MSEQNHSHEDKRPQNFFSSRGRIVLIGFLLIAGYFLITEHSAHLALAIPYLPYALLLACPLMHVFMHGGHGRHHDGHGDGDQNPTAGGTMS